MSGAPEEVSIRHASASKLAGVPSYC